jgi:uncharacterized RDD family membrane protein YckC
MAKEPGARFQSYDDLIGAMDNNSPVRTRPAGFWVRAFALALDALVLLLLTLPVDLLLPDDFDLLVFGGLALVYSIGCHGRWGRTLGKAALEIEVIETERQGRPRYRVAAARFAVQWGLVFLLAGIAALAEPLGAPEGVENGAAIALAVTLLLLYPIEGVWAAWSVPGSRTFWDRAAGTQVRYRRLDRAPPASPPAPV